MPNDSAACTLIILQVLITLKITSFSFSSFGRATSRRISPGCAWMAAFRETAGIAIVVAPFTCKCIHISSHLQCFSFKPKQDKLTTYTHLCQKLNQLFSKVSLKKLFKILIIFNSLKKPKLNQPPSKKKKILKFLLFFNN